MGPGFGLQLEGGPGGIMALSMPSRGDDAVAGLRQALLIAGAQSIVSSLWRVPVQETQALVDDFAGQWLSAYRGRNRFAAFHAAQLAALRRARQGGTGHPVTWGAFVYYGDPDDLSPSR